MDDDRPIPSPDVPRVRYLSLDWIAALTEVVAASSEMAALADEHRLGVTQVVTDGPEGTVVYHLQVGGGLASFGPGAAEPEDIRIQQSWETAVAVATGTLNAQEAFISGRIAVAGDPPLVVASQPVFGVIDGVFSSVRARTDYV